MSSSAAQAVPVINGRVPRAARRASSRADAAARAGLRTAFVQRPFEFGDPARKDLGFEPRFDVNAKDFIDLARRIASGVPRGLPA